MKALSKRLSLKGLDPYFLWASLNTFTASYFVSIEGLGLGSVKIGLLKINKDEEISHNETLEVIIKTLNSANQSS